MKRNKRKICIGCFFLVILLLAGVAAYFMIGFERQMNGPLYDGIKKQSKLDLVTVPRAESQQEHVALKLVWQADARQMYHYRLHSDMEISPLAMTTQNVSSIRKSNMQVDVDGVLNMRVLQIDQLVSVAFQLSSAKVMLNGVESPVLSEMYSKVFVALFSPYGKIMHYITPQVLTEKEKQSLSGLVASLQLVIPPEEYREDFFNWRSKEIDMAGSYVAQYVGTDCGVILKEKLQYNKLGEKPGGEDAIDEANKASEMFSAEIQSSVCQILINSTTSWLSEYVGQDHIVISANGSVFNESITDLELRPVPFKPDRFLAIWQLTGSYENMLQQVVMSGFNTRRDTDGDAWKKEKRKALKKKYKDVSIPDLQEEMQDAVDLAESHVDTIGAIHRLRDCLIAYPERARQLPALLKEEELTDEVAGRIIHAMELAGTPEAQTALGTIMTDDEQQRNQQLQAVVAAGGVDQPVDVIVDSLRAVRLDEESDQAMHNCSILALGSISKTFGTLGNEENKAALTEEIFQLLEDENGPDHEAALLALGNAGGVSGEELEPWLNAEDEMERAAACGALDASENDETMDTLSHIFGTDESVVVRKAAFQAIQNQGESALAAKLARERLPEEDNVLLKGHLVKCLGDDGSAASRAVLQTQLKTETNSDIKKQIYRALFLQNP